MNFKISTNILCTNVSVLNKTSMFYIGFIDGS